MDFFVSISSSPSPQCCFSISVTQQGIQKIIDFLCDLPWRFLTKGTVTAITSWIIFQENEGFILQKKKEAGNGWAQFSLRISPPRWNFFVFSIHPVNKKLKIPFWEAAGGSSITWGGFFFVWIPTKPTFPSLLQPNPTGKNQFTFPSWIIENTIKAFRNRAENIWSEVP